MGWEDEMEECSFKENIILLLDPAARNRRLHTKGTPRD
jgi:hypothetical protein